MAPPPPAGRTTRKPKEAKLRDHRLELAATVVTHTFWSTLSEADAPKTRNALKHVDDPQGDS
ncbi:hypothetical protein [Streptomyces chrestomyceticus]|uniref:hypothetical protein n=1 Tax=Streptomyces chrestomyceticus TaxID=68185 RepID=UPI0019CFFDD2|nr:hypothetical protein [Streptomyces chrestomyceticus]